MWKMPTRVAAGLLALMGAGAAMGQSVASPFTIGHRYDMMQRLTGNISPDPDGAGAIHYAAVRNTYDASGRLVQAESGELAAWQAESIKPSDWTGFTVFKIVATAYDGMDRKVTESVVTRDSSGANITHLLTQYSYNAVGRPECTTIRMNSAAFASVPASACTLGTQGSNGPDRVTKSVYDAAGQLIQTRKAVGTALEQAYASYTYTANGKQEYVTDANGNKAQYQYDGHDRQIRWRFPSGTVAGSVSTTDYEEYGYDANGNRTSLRKRDARVLTYSYDALNRMTSKLVSGNCVSGYACTTPPAWAVRNVYYDYDIRGLQLSARFDSGAPGNDGVTQTYDGAGRLTTSNVSMSGFSRTLSYQHDGDGNRTRLTHPDGTYFDYGYDGLNRMTSAAWYTAGSGTVPFLSIPYDAQGRRVATLRASSGTSYGYDAIFRPTSESQSFASGSANSTTTYTYSPASQITNQILSNDSYAFASYVAGATAYAVNGLNQYTAVAAGSLGYDSNGNLASTGGTTLTYDVENRLVQAAGTLTTTMIYDPLGHLFQSSGGASGTTRFLYDGDTLVAEYDGSGAMLARYAHGPGKNEPILADSGSAMNCSQTRFLHNDHRGSIIAQADCWGNPVAINRYDEYGVPGSGNVGRFQYTGQAWLPDLGMYYYKARIYSAKLGRFLQTDPIGYKDQMNLYAYAGNDPINARDVTGIDTEIILMGYQMGNAPIIGAYGHSYVVLRDTVTGETRVVRGGPSQEVAPDQKTASRAITNSSFTGVDGKTITLTAQIDPAGASPDWDKSGPEGGVVDRTVVKTDFSQVVQNATDFTGRVNAQGTTYRSQGPNSNSVAGSVFRQEAGRGVQNNSGVSFPGISQTVGAPPEPPPVCMGTPGGTAVWCNK